MTKSDKSAYIDYLKSEIEKQEYKQCLSTRDELIKNYNLTQLKNDLRSL